ncbi:ImmA/IrrE family metallo-endopeptidase [Vibrio sp. B172a]|uniref:ImmA/IrrE family metallo-endopeptidase n=1 Tax=Vibrio TaxID=662 RepID=UPI00066EB7FD|nr:MULTISPECIES: ImmA/IrrE family metallo-endopeptidase [Vibrio]MDK9781833.1 ImmA/IrrE family metallo-endopeptidase [Vibrio sp. B172a]HDM8201023.1 ImmA/IrrE family metallo-endopeptidase [Vibrio harveyi]
MNASQVLAAYWDYKLPVNVEDIAYKMGIKINKTRDDNHGSAYIDENGNKAINIDDSMPYSRQRYAIAHEIGHHVLGHVIDNGEKFYYYGHIESCENDAHLFARQLTMAKPVIDHILGAADISSVEQMSSIFGIEASKMRVRLKELKLV